MRRIYGIIVLILIAFSFWMGFHIGGRDAVPVASYDSIIQERDRIRTLLELSLERTKLHQEMAAIQKRKYEASDELVSILERSKGEQAKYYQAKIAAIQSYDSTELDQYFVNKYPDSTYRYRPSYNLATAQRQVKMSEWRVREVAMDRERLDSVSAVARNLDSTVVQQKESIAGRDRFIGTLNSLISEKDTTISLMVQEKQTYVAEVDVWKKTAKKYKRQRNGIIAGVSSVGLGIVAAILIPRI
jgi:hypothetical protein